MLGQAEPVDNARQRMVHDVLATLEELLITRFVQVQPDAFEIFLERDPAAEAPGYPRLG